MIYTIISLLIVIVFYLILKKWYIEKFSNSNLDKYYFDLVPNLYKTNENEITFKDTKNCRGGNLKIGYSDIAERDNNSYMCPDLEEKKLLKETLEQTNKNFGWKNLI